MGGVIITSLSLAGVFIFSVLLFFESSLCLSWFFLELASISLIPLFFGAGASANIASLFYYLVVSGLSSGMLLSGILFSSCAFFLNLGILIKFGIFPFMGWVYGVLKNSNWLAIWGFSTLLKSPFILVCFFFVVSVSSGQVVVILCSVSCVVLSVLFWLVSADWKICWCHMMLSSSSVLICLSFSGCHLSSLILIFLFYAVWSSFVLLFFFLEGLFEMSVNNSFYFTFLFGFLLLTLPVSFSVFYKVCVCISVFSCGILFLFCWVVYSISEQLYLLSFLLGLFGQKGQIGVSGLV